MRTALQIAAAIRAGETTAIAECEAAIARIETGDTAINAVVVRDFDRAREAARAIDASPKDDTRPLLGVPMTVKESFDVAGLVSCWGFEEHADFVATEDAVQVTRLKNAGAVILGKTNVPVALADLQTNNPVYGRTCNPLNHDRVPGGSSGGAAAALAAGFVPIEIGSDIGGSIRLPAAFCGVWGHKPTYNALSSFGHNFPRTQSCGVALNVVGPLARDPDDLETLFGVMGGDALARPAPRGPGDWRVLLLPEHPLAKSQAAIQTAIAAVGEAFRAAGAQVDDASTLLPDLIAQHGAYIHMLVVAMARGAPMEGGQPLALPDWFTLVDAQAKSRRDWARLFTHYDAVIAPIWGTTAYAHDDTPLMTRITRIGGLDTPAGLQMAYPGLATFPMLPATSVRIGTDPDGLPIGVQVIADYNRDYTAIAVARAAHDLMRS
ncbi:amidase family protein [Sphingomonas sp. PAMC 26621]|uniref:amidase family protein n=1 Tax=Sphingomonas sp. PAMC 26621 TaxID=1112213 RepID=UPI000289C453|nr:amidase family protein [Sphingomonas sp. PAMC 26621]